MTYPNYPPPPNAGYAAPPPPPPMGGQWPQGPQQSPAPAGPPAELNIVDPRGGGGFAPAPLPRHLMQHGGYAILLLPRSYDPNNAGPGGAIRPQITVDMVVVNVGRDGGVMPPIEFGDNQDRDYSKQRPNHSRLDAFPAEFTGVQWTNQEVVKDLVEHVGTGALIAARVVQGTQGNRPPLLEKLTPEDPARAALAEAWHQRLRQPGSLRRTVETGGLVHINGGPPVKQDAPAGQGMPPQPGQQVYAHPQTTASYPAQLGGPAQGAGYVPPPGAQVNYQQAPPPPPPPGAYPPPPNGAVPPAAAAAQGWTPEQWAVAPPHVKAAYGA